MRIKAKPWMLLAALALLVGGCASFHPLPLSAAAPPPADLKVDAAKMPTWPLAAHRFDPRDGLDATETAMLAVANNPDLRVLRDQLGIARAQAFAAGLLPDPQLSAAQDFVTGHSGGPGATNPFGIGISWDVGQLLTRSARTRAAGWSRRQIDLQLLWAEWQTVARARVLFDEVTGGRRLVARLRRETAALQPFQRRVEQALDAHALSFEVASTGLNAEAEAQRQLVDAGVALNQSEHDLRRLLGLSPSAPLTLVGAADAPRPDARQVAAALADLPRRRPDLLALQAGYAAQNDKLREAILAQYPAIGVGFNRARDNSAVYTSGVSISLTLPLFNRNRGNIAIARATRRQLHDDYAARLMATRNDVDRLRADLQRTLAAAPAAEAQAQRLDQALRRARTAWQAGQLEWPIYLSIRGSALAADLQRLALRRQAAGAGIALQTLLGGRWSATARQRMQADVPPLESAGGSP
ncbi:MAG: TolC family protein [Gammaproteobacteria bacterium]|nr:TolC family protein [Gammaproteobacteria bacterium]